MEEGLAHHQAGRLPEAERIYTRNVYFNVTGEGMDRMSRALIAQSDAEPGYVAYACNRAMTFRSNALHKTHRLKIKDAYPHRRISITCLYGKLGP